MQIAIMVIIISSLSSSASSFAGDCVRVCVCGRERPTDREKERFFCMRKRCSALAEAHLSRLCSSDGAYKHKRRCWPVSASEHSRRAISGDNHRESSRGRDMMIGTRSDRADWRISANFRTALTKDGQKQQRRRRRRQQVARESSC
jgi:hypothetical protein